MGARVLVASTQQANDSRQAYLPNPPRLYGRTEREHTSFLYAYGLGVGAAAILGYACWRLFHQKPEPFLQTAKCTSEASNEERDEKVLLKRFNFLAEAVEKAAPAVVFIEKSEPVRTMFGVGMAVSAGSGFIVDEKGYVLTNAHVVGTSQSVSVKLLSGRVVSGIVVDTDQVSDLALIKLDVSSNEKLPVIKFGSSADLRPGEWVVAVGSPLSLSNTITAGIISSVLRPSKELGLQHHKPGMEYVQTDALITRGNSGGPLVNLDGEVIGVNTMTAGPGISFAIPSDFAKLFVEQANKSTKANRRQTAPRYGIGISMLSLTLGLIRSSQFHLPKEVTHGVYLVEVSPRGPAAKAGLRKGDILVRVNAKNLKSSGDLYEAVQLGKPLVIELIREGQWGTVSVTPEILQ